MLSATKVKNIKEKGDYSDGNGLYLRVGATGKKNWIFRYTFNGKRSNMGLGFKLSLAEARQKVLELGDRIDKGLHPKEEIIDTATFKSMAKAFIEMRRGEWKNKKHAQQWTNTLETYAYPFIGDMQVSDIKTKHIKAILDPIWNAKPETATRVRSRVQNVIDYSIAMGESDRANPAALTVVKKVLPKQVKDVKHFSALPYSEVSEFYASLGDAMSHLAIRFVILTACRTGEVIGAEWSEIDGDVWVIPKVRTKANREHRVPLSTQAIELLENMDPMNDYIFPSPSFKPKGLSNIAMLKATKGINPEITVHGFRSSFRDWVEEVTIFDSRLAEAALAHVIEDKTVAAYQRSDLLEKRRLMMQEWANFVAGIYD